MYDRQRLGILFIKLNTETANYIKEIESQDAKQNMSIIIESN